MSITISVMTGRKKAISELLKAVAEFLGGASNKRISVNLEVDMNPKET